MDISTSSKNITYGITSSLAFVLWSVWGGFILHMLLSNYLAVLIKPLYDIPVDNVNQVLGWCVKIFGIKEINLT